MEPDQIIPKLLDLKHQNQVRRLGTVMAEIRVIESKRAELAREQKNLDLESDGFARLSVQNGYLRYLQARSEALENQEKELQLQAIALQQGLKETMCSQSILDDHD